jgi:hypothetical protein
MSLSNALIVTAFLLMGMAAFLFYRLRLHKYLAIRQRQRRMGMPSVKEIKRKTRKKGTKKQAESQDEELQDTETGKPDTDIADIPDKWDEGGRGGTTKLSDDGTDPGGRYGTTRLTEEEKISKSTEGTTRLTDEEKVPESAEGTTRLTEDEEEAKDRTGGHGMTQELDEEPPGTTLLDKEQKDAAARLGSGDTWIPASRTFQIKKTVIITHAKEGEKNNV